MAEADSLAKAVAAHAYAADPGASGRRRMVHPGTRAGCAGRGRPTSIARGDWPPARARDATGACDPTACAWGERCGDSAFGKRKLGARPDFERRGAGGAAGVV